MKLGWNLEVDKVIATISRLTFLAHPAVQWAELCLRTSCQHKVHVVHI